MEIREKDELEIDIRELFSVLMSKAAVIVLTGAIFALAGLLVTQLFITPKFQSTTSFYVMNRQDDSLITSSDLNVSTTLTSDVVLLVTSRTVLEQVIKIVGLDCTIDELIKDISVENLTNTRIVEVTVTNEDAHLAKQIADAIAEVAAEQVVELIGTVQVNIIDQGNIADKPSTPSLTKNIIIAGAAGVIVAIFITGLFFVLDDTIRT